MLGSALGNTGRPAALFDLVALGEDTREELGLAELPMEGDAIGVPVGFFVFGAAGETDDASVAAWVGGVLKFLKLRQLETSLLHSVWTMYS